MNVHMRNESHELLFIVASEFIELNHNQQRQVGFRLGLIDFNALCMSSTTIEEMIFTNAYSQNKMFKLVTEIQKIKHEQPK